MIKDYLRKATKEAEAYDLALGIFRIPNDGSIVPRATGELTREEFERTMNLVSSQGSRILSRKLDGIIGTISVTGSDAIKSEIDEQYDLRFLVERATRDMIVKGIAGLALGVDQDGVSYVYRLGGFIARLYSEVDVDQEVGLLQIEQNADGTYEVRRFYGSLVEHWTHVRDVRHINWDAPHNEYDNGVEYVSFTAAYQEDADGQAIGEVEQLAPVLKGLMAIDARIHRASEAFGYPIPVLKGTVTEIYDESRSIVNAIGLSENSSLEYLVPTGFDHLIKQKGDLVSQLDKIATLPHGFIGTGNQPSGEAIREANQAFNSSVSRYSRLLSRLFTNAFYELFKAKGYDVTDFSLVINPNTIQDMESEINAAVMLLEKGLLTPEYVVSILQKKYEGINDDMAAQILEHYQSRNTLINPVDVLGSL